MTSPTVAYRRRVPPSTLMHISVRAPLLSAALSIVRSWIMAARSSLARALDDREQAPGFAARERPARPDRHRIALPGLVVLIMRQQLGRAADVLAVGRMADHPLDLDRDGLVHLVADDLSGQRTGALALGLRFGAHALPPARLARCTVFTRAMFLRTLRN